MSCVLILKGVATTWLFWCSISTIWLSFLRISACTTQTWLRKPHTFYAEQSITVHLVNAAIIVHGHLHAVPAKHRIFSSWTPQRHASLTEAWLQMCCKVLIGANWDVGKLMYQIRPEGFQLIPEGSSRDDDWGCDQTHKGNIICTHARASRIAANKAHSTKEGKHR